MRLTKLFMSMLLLVAFLPLQAWAAPQLQPESTEHHFGAVKEGQVVDHTFRFINEGDSTLEIERVRTSCGCTAAVVRSRRIEPGEQGEIAVSFDTAGFRGAVSKSIYVYTNNPQEPKSFFRMAGRVNPLIHVSSSHLRFRDLIPGETNQRKVRVSNQSEVPVQFLSVEATSDQVAADLDKKELAPGEAATLTVDVKLADAGQRISGYVLLKTDHPVADSLRLVVRGYPR